MADLAKYIKDSTDGLVTKIEKRGEDRTIWCKPETLRSLLVFLRDDNRCLFKQLIDLCGVDYPERVERFEVVYHLLSLKLNQRIRVKVGVADQASVPSIVNLFSAANWLERETWDMYGIKFEGHPDLRRLLTDYGFQGHPLRKDFPLTGHVEIRYDDTERRIVSEPVNLRQDFRQFDFESPWEGQWDKIGKHVLPGDEKATQDETDQKESA